MSFLPKSVKLKDGSSITIREATPADAAGVIDMIKKIISEADFTLTQVDEFQVTEEEKIAILEKYQQIDGHIYLVAESNGILIGDNVFSNGLKSRNKHQGEFALGVIPTFRKRGVANALLETLMEWAEKHPLIYKVKLRVVIQNYNAIHLYRNLGFIEEGRLIKDHRTDDGEFMDMIAMYKLV
ncbi:MAG: RimJ/RimL family protein N-acetyltransferase [Gammaproteobacteria bacterium]|jgi:RimJ/RimL family protein N-acetyltransferase